MLNRLQRFFLYSYASAWLVVFTLFVVLTLTPDRQEWTRALVVASASCLGIAALIEVLLSVRRSASAASPAPQSQSRTRHRLIVILVLTLPLTLLVLGQAVDLVFPFIPRSSTYSESEEAIFRARADKILQAMEDGNADDVLTIWESDGVTMPSHPDQAFLSAINSGIPATGYDIEDLYATQYPRDGRELGGVVTFEFEDGSQVTILLGLREVEGVYRLSGFPSRSF